MLCMTLHVISPSIHQVMEYKHLYMPTHKMSAIFGGHGYGKNSMLKVGQVREVVTSYIKANDLVAKDNPRFESSGRIWH